MSSLDSLIIFPSVVNRVFNFLFDFQKTCNAILAFSDFAVEAAFIAQSFLTFSIPYGLLLNFSLSTPPETAM